MLGTESDTMSKLKACPFCGGTDVLSERGGVHCEGCGARVGAAAAWNRREPDWQELAREMATAIAKLRAANASTVMDPRYTYVRSSRVLMDAYVDLAGVESKARKAGLLEEKHE